MNKLFQTASRIATPLSLASVIVIALYLIYKAVLALEIFSILEENNTLILISSIVDKLFYLASIALVLSIASYIYTQYLKHIESNSTKNNVIDKSEPKNKNHIQPLINQKLGLKIIGRDKHISDIMIALQESSGKRIVGINGMGGIGKTSLAREVTDLCLYRQLFDFSVWLQASKQAFMDENSVKGELLTFETTLNAIGHQLHFSDIARLEKDAKKERIRALLCNKRILVTLDNLETAEEHQNDIIDQLQPLFHNSQSKSLLTSRHHFKGEIYRIPLAGLSRYDSLHLIRKEAEQRNINHVLNAENEELEAIFQVTGGSPLALKFVVGQLSYLPLQTVVSQLCEIQLPENEINENEYILFYKFIFLPSWQLLSDEGKQLLISMTRFSPGVGGTYESIKVISSLSDNTFSQCIKELLRLSFLEIGKSPNLNQMRYYLHALTHHFILSDIIRVI
jgi:hypothetical protein